MLMVDTDAVVVEARLLVGELGCPSCGGVLRPWGHARWRFSRGQEGTVRHRPRRASCGGCAETHGLLPPALRPPLAREAGPRVRRESVFADAWGARGRAGAAGVRRLRPRPPWEFASWATGGLLLAPPVKPGSAAGAGTIGRASCRERV